MNVEVERRFAWIERLRGRAEPRVFVTGMPKSGTTAIVRLMGHCAGVESTSDPFHILDRVGVEYRDDLFGGQLACSQLLEKYPSEFRGPLVKDPNFVFFYEELRDRYPDAAWIFTVRDPRDNIRSILNRLGLPGDSATLRDLPKAVNATWRRVLEGRTPAMAGVTVIERLAYRWLTVAEICHRSGPSITLSRYEDFIEDKEAVIRGLCRAVNIKPKHSLGGLIDKAFQPAGDRGISWQRFFAPEDLSAIERICAPLLPAFGYAPQQRP